MRILAFDLATKCGWAFKEESKRAKHGTESLENKKWDGAGMRFVKFIKFVHDLLEKYKPELVVFEGVRRHRGTDAAHIYGGFMATLQTICESNNVPYTAYGVTEIKKFWTGQGYADKQAMINVATDRGYNPEDDNAADALAILFFALEKLDTNQ